MNKTEQTDKLTQVLDAIEHPDRYSDEQLQKLLSDEECAEYYRLMCDATSAYASTHEESEAEIEAEWQRFTARHTPQISIWRKVAAVFIGFLLVSGLSLAAITYIKSSDKKEVTPSNTQTTTPFQQSITPATAKADTITFENAELQEILTELANHYGLRTEYRKEEARHTRLYIKWNKAEDAQVMIERLNRFEKVNIKLDKDLMIAE